MKTKDKVKYQDGMTLYSVEHVLFDSQPPYWFAIPDTWAEGEMAHNYMPGLKRPRVWGRIKDFYASKEAAIMTTVKLVEALAAEKQAELDKLHQYKEDTLKQMWA